LSGRPRISIVTPSLNQAAFAERTVESVLSQQGDFDLEYLVYDGGSTDGTLEVLRRHAGAGRLRLVVEPDRGQADAINKGLRAASGDILGFLNSDDILYPGALARVADAFRREPGALWVHGKCEIVDERDRPIRGWVTAYKERRCRRYSHRSLLIENFISQMTVFWRSSVHERVGYLDASLRYSFDYEFWLRLAGLGDPVYIPERQAAFRWYRTSKSGSSFRRQFEEDLAAFHRHAPPEALLRLRKRIKNAQIVAAYRLLRLAGGG